MYLYSSQDILGSFGPRSGDCDQFGCNSLAPAWKIGMLRISFDTFVKIFTVALSGIKIDYPETILACWPRRKILLGGNTIVCVFPPKGRREAYESCALHFLYFIMCRWDFFLCPPRFKPSCFVKDLLGMWFLWSLVFLENQKDRISTLTKYIINLCQSRILWLKLGEFVFVAALA